MKLRDEKPMADTITITIPETPKEREEVLRFLSEHGLVSKEKTSPRTPKKGKWARVAEKLSRENALGNGLGDEFRAGMREFRENLVFKSELTSEDE